MNGDRLLTLPYHFLEAWVQQMVGTMLKETMAATIMEVEI